MPMRLTRSVKVLLICSFVTFLIQQTADQFFGTSFLAWLSLIPSLFWESHAYWQILTYSFVQRDVMQLFFNFMMLAFIGSELEAVWGSVRFLRYYFFCATVSGLLYVLFQWAILKGNSPLMGPSGAVYGLLMAYGLLFGERVLLFMMLFPMKAKHFVWVLGLLELLTTLYSSSGSASGFALLAGMGAGFLYLWVVAKWQAAQRRGSFKSDYSGLSKLSKAKKKRKAGHLKLVVNQTRPPSNDSDSEGGNPKTWH